MSNSVDSSWKISSARSATTFSIENLEAAAKTVHRIVAPTPQIRWPLLCLRAGTDVWVKHENHTLLGAFKVRGGLIYVDELQKRESSVNGLIAATRGNHGQSIAFAGVRAGLRVVVVVPHGNSKEKNAAMCALGAELIEYGTDFQDAYEYAGELAREEKMHFVKSFDRSLVLGVGSFALELFRGIPALDTVYVPIGLGSSICGTIAVRDALGLTTEIVGVVPAEAKAYSLSLAAGHPITSRVGQTIADGMACRVPDPEAFEMIRNGVSRIVTVTEDEIREAIRCLFADTHNAAEGAGATSTAALLQESCQMRGRRVAVMLSGGNIDSNLFARAILST
jgi:threonine dehydratase